MNIYEKYADHKTLRNSRLKYNDVTDMLFLKAYKFKAIRVYQSSE